MRQRFQSAEARAELVLALCFIVLSAAVWLSANQLPPPIFDPLGSAAVPKLIAVVVALLAVAMIFQRASGHTMSGTVPDPEEDGEADAPLRPGTAAACFAAMAAYPLVMGAGILGFREASFVFVLTLGGFLSHFERRTMAVLLATAALTALGLDWLFTSVFYIDLPTTIWLPF